LKGVKWLEWSEDAFRKARESGKLILLSISASWCHWCHVMDKTSYSDEEVIRLVNEKFVPVRVDNDKRPDINRRYNMGGWPTIAFLTSEGEPIGGGTYWPPDQLKEILSATSRFYEENKGRVHADSRKWASQIEKEMRFDKATQNLSSSIVDEIILSIVESFDQVYGGFGDRPKFPSSEALELGLSYYWHTGERGLLNIVTKSLDLMANGEIHDREAGGFFRYATARDWRAPHFEKMCEDNARLVANYLHAFQVAGNARYRDIAKSILEYVDSTLCNRDDGGFYGSQTADEEYYRLSGQERQSRSSPAVDKTIYTSWNAMMASSYLLASILLGETEYQEFALKAISILLKKCYVPNREMFHYYAEGGSQIPRMLADQVYMARCLLDAYQISLEKSCLEAAEDLAAFMLHSLYDSENGGFFDKVRDSSDLGALRGSVKPIDENAVAADVLTVLYYLTGNENYLSRAEETLQLFSESFRQVGILSAAYGLSVDRFLNPVHVSVIGPRDDSLTRDMICESLRLYEPRKIVEVLDPTLSHDRISALGYSFEGNALAYICIGQTCLRPITDPKKISEQIRRFSRSG